MSAGSSRRASSRLVLQESAQRDTGALVRPPKPWDLAPDERLAEMGELLATAFLRYRRKRLADGAGAERPCDRTVDATEEAA